MKIRHKDNEYVRQEVKRLIIIGNEAILLFLPDFLWVTYLILDTSPVLGCGPLLSHRGEAADDTERRRFRESAAIVWLPPAKYNPPSPYCHASCMDVTVVKKGSTLVAFELDL